METFIKNIKKYNKKWRNATLMDDLKFRMIAKSKGAVEEILRTILKDDKLEVIETIEQRNRSHAYFHGVILDCECRLKTKDKKLKELFEIFTTIDYNNKEIFPRLSEDKIKIIDKYTEGKYMMSGLTLEIFKDGEKAGREVGRAEGMQQLLDNLVRKGILTKEEADKELRGVNK